MLRFERQHCGNIRDVLCIPTASAGEAVESLRNGGFIPCLEVCDEADDEEGCPWPPLSAEADGGGNWNHHVARYAVPMKLWSKDEATGCGVGFDCKYDMAKSILYAKLEMTGIDVGAQRSLKGAITSLFDVSEASGARRITIGLGAQQAGNPECVCNLLYLGFQVTHPRKAPLANIALLLDFNIGWPTQGPPSTSDQTVTGTSECSTSAEDVECRGCEIPDSD